MCRIFISYSAVTLLNTVLTTCEWGPELNRFDWSATPTGKGATERSAVYSLLGSGLLYRDGVVFATESKYSPKEKKTILNVYN